MPKTTQKHSLGSIIQQPHSFYNNSNLFPREAPQQARFEDAEAKTAEYSRAAFPIPEWGGGWGGEKGKGAQPHLQFGVGCIDQPIAQDRMPVLNVGPTVRQGRIQVSSQ